MSQCNGKLTASVFVLRPANAAPGWERTDLWENAAAIPGVSVVADEDGKMARRLGAAISGQAVLYGTDGRLLFAGGITQSRGHSGDNAGRAAIVTLVMDSAITATAAAATATAAHPPVRGPVFGCSLFDDRAVPHTHTQNAGATK
jgi:hypothetical protein